MRNLFAIGAAVAAIAMPAAALAGVTTTTYGSVQVVNSGPVGNAYVFEITSSPDVDPGYGGLKFTLDEPFTVDDITALTIDYKMVEGGFGGGAPRFTLKDDDGHAAYIYLGDFDTSTGLYSNPTPGVWSSANVFDSQIRVESNGFGSFSSTYPGLTWGAFVNKVGGTNISRIYFDVDGGYTAPGQKVLADNFRINGNVFSATPEPASWALMIGGFGLAGAALRRRRVAIAA